MCHQFSVTLFMDHKNDYFFCPDCLTGSPIVLNLQTGEFLRTNEHLKYFKKHNASRPTSPLNGVFLGTGRNFYESGIKYFAKNAWAGIDRDGNVNFYTVFLNPIAMIERSGTPICETTTGKMTLANMPDVCHWFGYGSLDSNGRPVVCHNCSGYWQS